MTAPAPAAPAGHAPGAEAGWEALVGAALVGTDRRPVPATGLDPALDAALAGRPPEEALLGAAAALAARRRVGALAGPAPPLPVPAPPDGRVAVPAAAVELLALVLTGQVDLAGAGDAVVAQWLDRVAARDLRVAPRLHPRLLALATRRAELRDGVRAVLGGPGGWLAATDPTWAWFGDGGTGDAVDVDALAARFATAGQAARVALLRRVRAVDPARGRELLAGTWATAAAAERAALLSATATGIGDDDEPALEAALDDRAAAVRAAAAELLDHLPTSRRAARMAARLDAVVRVEGRRRELHVDLPPEPDAAARRDGAGADGPRRAGGPRAAWLRRIVAGAPLAWWTAHVRPTAVEVVAVGHGNADLVAGWERAAVAQRDAAWAKPLSALRPTAELLALLDPVAVETVAVAHLAAAKGPAAAAQLVRALPTPWSPTLGRHVVDRLAALDSAVALQVVAPELAAHLDPSLAPEVAAWAADAHDATTASLLRGVHHAMALRAAIAEALP